MLHYRQSLDLFYRISGVWTPRDRRYQAIVGHEYELCVKSVKHLREIALCEMNSDVPRWVIGEDRAALAALFARAFVDHAVGVHKVLRGYSKDGWIADLTGYFYDENRGLFELRNALQHSYDRIDSDLCPENIDPLCGDLSWCELTNHGTLDLYLIAYGPWVDEQVAFPPLDMEAFRRFGLNDIVLRSHEKKVNIIETFHRVTTLVREVHSGLSARLDEALSQAGIIRGSIDDVRLPGQLSGRLRAQGARIAHNGDGTVSVTSETEISLTADLSPF